MIHWRHVFLLTGIIGVAACLRLWQIDSIPPGFHLDESFEGLEAWRILTDPEYRPIFLTGNFGVPPLNAYANAVSFGVAGLFGVAPGPTTMRVTAAVFGLLGVIALFALGDELRRLDTRRLTLAFPYLAAAMLATMRWHIHFSRMGIEPVLVPLLWAASLWLFLRGWRTGAWLWFAACGVLLAACLYTYQGAWIIPLLMAPITGILWWSGRNSVSGDCRQSNGYGAPCRGHRVAAPGLALGMVLCRQSGPAPPAPRADRRDCQRVLTGERPSTICWPVLGCSCRWVNLATSIPGATYRVRRP